MLRIAELITYCCFSPSPFLIFISTLLYTLLRLPTWSEWQCQYLSRVIDSRTSKMLLLEFSTFVYFEFPTFGSIQISVGSNWFNFISSQFILFDVLFPSVRSTNNYLIYTNETRATLGRKRLIILLIICVMLHPLQIIQHFSSSVTVRKNHREGFEYPGDSDWKRTKTNPARARLQTRPSELSFSVFTG